MTRRLIASLTLAGAAFSGVVADDAFAHYGDPRDPEVLGTIIREIRDDFVLIDVRTIEEYEEGHIPTAQNIDHREIARAMVEGDRSKPVILYCRTGRRSGIAARDLERLGYQTIIDFGGINRWRGEIETDN
ncbi:MAG: rhodanese-like domain-containing protein [Spirochaetales bacterium]|nr:rhodanese-like domain-containing protein [Spirochaetales bacterium]